MDDNEGSGSHSDLAHLFFSILKLVLFKKKIKQNRLTGIGKFSNPPRLYLIFVFIFYFLFIYKWGGMG